MIDDELIAKFMTMMHKFRKTSRKPGSKFGISFTEMAVVGKMFELLEETGKDSISMGELARNLEMTKPMLTHITDKLEASNTLQRSPSTEDRRVILLSFTQHGMGQFECHRREMDEMIARLLRRLGRDKTSVLLSIMEELFEIIKEETAEKENNSIEKDAQMP